jgi:hypothetical protein
MFIATRGENDGQFGAPIVASTRTSPFSPGSPTSGQVLWSRHSLAAFVIPESCGEQAAVEVENMRYCDQRQANHGDGSKFSLSGLLACDRTFHEGGSDCLAGVSLAGSRSEFEHLMLIEWVGESDGLALGRLLQRGPFQLRPVS